MKKGILFLCYLFSSLGLLQGEEIYTNPPRVEFTKVTARCAASVRITVDFSIHDAKSRRCELRVKFYDSNYRRLVSSNEAFRKFYNYVTASIPFTVYSNSTTYPGVVFDIPCDQFNLKGSHNLKYKLMVVSDGQTLGTSNFYDLKCNFPTPINGSGGSSTDGTTSGPTQTTPDNLCSVDITLDKCTDYQNYGVLIKQLGGAYSDSKLLKSKNVQFNVPKGEYEIIVFEGGKSDGPTPYRSIKTKVDQTSVKLTLPRIQ